jgi:hypothetical protein
MTAYAEKRSQEIRADIDRYGRHIVGVFPTKDDVGPPFAYTIGNEEKGLPELLVIGVSRNGGFLNILSDMMVERGGRFADGELVDIGGPYPVKVIDANATAQTEYTVQAGVFHGYENYSVQQVLVPDRDGHFPDDARCDARYRMPVLGQRRH